MSAANRRNGLHFQRQIRQYLDQRGIRTITPQAGQHEDQGDILAGPNLQLLLEVKRIPISKASEALREAHLEAEHAAARHPAAVVRRRGHADPGEQYVVMTVATLANIIQDQELSR